MTSVGSGSIMIVLLLFLYPGKPPFGGWWAHDLVQAVALIRAAALGHVLPR